MKQSLINHFNLRPIERQLLTVLDFAHWDYFLPCSIRAEVSSQKAVYKFPTPFL